LIVSSGSFPISRDDRFSGDTRKDNREPGQRDRDRVLYTTAFQRLAEVTQVLAPDEGHVFHNRLTHSLKVAQVARRLAEMLGREQPDAAAELGINPDVVEAAALAHDLGHPPFGHVAEEELDVLVTRAGLEDGFNGNAQSFRIVTNLALRSPKYSGLDLTRATLNALLKYPWMRGPTGKQHQKWGAYKIEQAQFEWARGLCPDGDRRKSAEAELMDWADDVTYAVHDVADFFRAGLIPLDRLAKESSERDRFLDKAFERRRQEGTDSELGYPQPELKETLARVADFIPFDERYTGTTLHRSTLRSYTAGLIARFMTAAQLHVPLTPDESRIKLDPDSHKEVVILKELTWHYVILNPSLMKLQYGQRHTIRRLFAIFNHAARNSNLGIFPHAYRELIRDAGDDMALRTRLVCDYISGMTEHQAIGTHQRLTLLSKIIGSPSSTHCKERV
jgi:dGTPase